MSRSGGSWQRFRVRGAPLLRRAADPGGEQVTEADDSAHLASFEDGHMTEAVQGSYLGCVLDCGIRPGWLPGPFVIQAETW